MAYCKPSERFAQKFQLKIWVFIFIGLFTPILNYYRTCLFNFGFRHFYQLPHITTCFGLMSIIRKLNERIFIYSLSIIFINILSFNFLIMLINPKQVVI